MENNPMNKDLYIDYFCRLSDESMQQILHTVGLKDKKSHERVPLFKRVSRKQPPVTQVQNTNVYTNYGHYDNKKQNYGHHQQVQQQLHETPYRYHYPRVCSTYQEIVPREFLYTEDLLYQNVYETLMHCSNLNNNNNNAYNRIVEYPTNMPPPDQYTWYHQMVYERS